MSKLLSASRRAVNVSFGSATHPIFFSGQVELLEGKLVEGFEKQLRQALHNLFVEAAKASIDACEILKINVLLAGTLEDAVYDEMNRIYYEVFAAELESNELMPARTTCFVARLPLGALVEIDAVAQEDPSYRQQLWSNNLAPKYDKCPVHGSRKRQDVGTTYCPDCVREKR